MVRIPESVLKKMSKTELINLVNEFQSELEKAKTVEVDVVKDNKPENLMAKLDKKLNEMDRSNRAPRAFKEPKYVCHSCNAQFIDETTVFVKDLNDPLCFNCRRRR